MSEWKRPESQASNDEAGGTPARARGFARPRRSPGETLMIRSTLKTIVMFAMIVMFALPVHAADSKTAAPAAPDAGAAELAKQLSNPVASLINLPLQANWDFGIGPANATKFVLNVQPVIPFSLNPKWNLITRTIVPFISAGAPSSAGRNTSGIGDIVQSFFFSPKAPASSGWIWGAGPVFLYPSANEDALGTGKWGMGPTVVLLKQKKGVTYGLLANHLESFAGDESRDVVSATFLQPFVSKATKKFTTYSLNTETTYDWKNSQWSVPINATVSQILKAGKQPLSVGFGGRIYAAKPDGGPDWGLRATLTLMWPK